MRETAFLEMMQSMRESSRRTGVETTDIPEPTDKKYAKLSEVSTNFVDRRRPENEAERQAVHAAGFDRRKTYIGPERRSPKNQALRDSMDKKIGDFAENGEIPVIDSIGKDVYAVPGMETRRKTGNSNPMLGAEDGILID